MRLIMSAAAALLFLVMAALPCPAEDAPPKPARVIVTGWATIDMQPDQGRLVVGVLTKADKAADAARDNALAMAEVKAALQAKLGSGDTLESLGYSLRRRTRWNDKTRTQEVLGYEAKHRLLVTSKDPKALGALLDAAVKAGANLVEGPSWGLSDPAQAQAQRQALAKAYANAKAQAQAIARAAGMKLGDLIKVKVPEQSRGPLRKGAMAMAPNAETDLEPGQVTVQARLQCVFSLLP